MRYQPKRLAALARRIDVGRDARRKPCATALLAPFALAIAIAALLTFAPVAGAALSELAANPLSRTLIAAEGQWLESGWLEHAAEEGRRTSPEAIAVRERSQSAWRHLDGAQIAWLARTDFPSLVERSSSDALNLPSGIGLERYLTTHAALVSAAGGHHAVVESLAPIARPAGHGNYAALNLDLTSSGGSYSPAATTAPVRFPRNLASGISSPTTGVTLTPVNATGRPLHGAPATQDAQSVLYSETQPGTDTLAKPTARGFDLDTLIRSPQSPDNYYFHISIPAAARLIGGNRPGRPIGVETGAGLLAAILPPQATAANGEPVPVTMTRHGATLVVNVSHSSADEYPIMVDPETVDANLTGAKAPTRWKFGPLGSPHFTSWGFGTEEWLEIESTGEYKAGEGAYLVYETQGESHIYWVGTELKVQNEGNIEAVLQLAHRGSDGDEEAEETKLIAPAHSEVYERSHFAVCAEYPVKPTCPIEGNWYEYGAPHNEVRLQESATATGSGYNHANLISANVFIDQANGPENPTFNTSEAELASDQGRHNVFYGSGGWLSPASGAYEVKAKDPGVGIKTLLVKVPGIWRKEYTYFEGHLCEGVQCRPEATADLTYNSVLPNGEDTVEVESEDGVGSWSKVTEGKLKVDTTQPYNLKISGIAETGAELTATPHELIVEATQGKAPTPSSGIREITATVDGVPIQPTTPANCTATECTAKATFVIHGEAYGVGPHHLVITAVSGAGEEAKREITFDTLAGNSVPLGPGRIDPITGQFGLQATDVDLSGVGGISRTYLSESTANQSPLGPQWKLNVGTGDELEILPNGNAELSTNGSSHLVSFHLNSAGEYEAPSGDTNLKLSYEAKEHAYLLADATAGTVMKFTQPEGSQAIAPSSAFTFGTPGSEAEQFARPSEAAVNAAGDIYIADTGNNRILKFGREGNAEASYGTLGSGNGQFDEPTGVAINQANGDIYVSDRGNTRVEELGPTGTYIQSFGTSGAGAGQFAATAGVAIDAHENVWVADTTNERIDVFSSAGTFLHAFGWGVANGEAKFETCTTTCRAGLSGPGAGEFASPAAIAFSAGKAFITDAGNARVDVFSESETPAYEKSFGTYGSGTGEFEQPIGIATEPVSGDVYVVDHENDRVEVFNTAGTFEDVYGGDGTAEDQLRGPQGIAISSSGVQYVVDSGNDRVSSWARPTWMGTTAEGPAETTATTYAYEAVVIEGAPVIEPVFEVGPKPAGVTCSAEASKAEKGCRELTFKYGTKDTAGSGESPGEWGEYAGRLMQVLFTAYNPATKAMMIEQPVADYLYDSHGRLRQEWDPRIPGAALKTTYGYDSENHLAAYTPPGTQPWLFHYGRLGSDLTTGRLLSLMRPAAKAAMSITEPAPLNTAIAMLSSTTPAVGTKISVASNGTWTHNLAYAYTYSWSDCVSASECTPIPGAVNQSYYPQTSDVGKRLQATITAYNSTGAVAATTATTSLVASGTPINPAPEPPSVGNLSVYSVDYNIPASGTGAPHELSNTAVADWGQTDVPSFATAFFPPDEPMGWPAKDYTKATLQYLDSHGREVNVYAPSGGISTTEYNAANEVVRVLSAENRSTAMLESCGSPCASAEKAERLDAKTEYEANDERIIKKTGPEHPIKLANGEEKEGRLVTRLSYDEGASEVEAVTHEKYALVTKTTTAALLASGSETEERVTETSYSGQNNLGWKLRAPTLVTNDATGLKIVHSTEYEPATGRVIATKAPLGGAREASFAENIGHEGGEPGQFDAPTGMARDSKGNIWLAVAGGYGVDEFGADGSFVRRFGEQGTAVGDTKAPEDLAIAPGGNVYVADTGNNRIDRFTETGAAEASLGSEGTGDLQFKAPGGIAITSSGTRWIVDTGNNRLQELNSKDEFVEVIGFGVTNGEAKFETCTSACKAGVAGSGEGQFNKPRMIAVAPSGDIYVTDSENGRVEVFSATGGFLSILGKKGTKAGEFSQPVSIAINTNGLIYVGDKSKGVVDEFKANNEFIASIGTKGEGPGELEAVDGVLTSPEGQLYIANVGVEHDEMQEWRIEAASAGAHNTLTVYYSAAANAEYKECGEHREWQGLVCETRPMAQPEDKPELAVSQYSYNVWDASEAVSETFGTTKRTKAKTFDAAGRVTASEVSSTTDTAVPKTTNSYSEATGALEKQSTTSGETTHTVTTKRNGLGQLSEYTDADGAITVYHYEEGGDARLLEVTQSRGSEAKASQTYSYQPTTGVIDKLVDSALGTITATYNEEGAPAAITLPDGLTEKYTHNALGEVTKLEDVKASHCGSSCVWFSDKVVPGVYGEVLKQATTFAEEPKIVVNEAGQPTEVQEIPTGKGCTVRKYGWNEDSDRTDVQTFAPGTEGKCATASGAPNEAHSYDAADRLDDGGVVYETFGNTTTMPAADANGHELLSTFYVDNQVATQSQNGETLKYAYDPVGREREIVKEGTVSTTTIAHYDEPGEAVAWTSEGSEKWTRNIPGISGSLAGTMHVGESPVLLIHDLQGDVVATAADSEGEEKLLSTYNSTEFGVPNEGKAPPAYAWLGAEGLKSELTISGTITNGAGSYVPEVARSLATETVEPPGAYPQGSGPGAPYTTSLSDATLALGSILAAGAPAREGERQKALEEEARRRAAEAEAAADPKCIAQVATGTKTSSTGREWVYARGWGWCGSDTLPKYSTLEVCLGSELEGEVVAAGPASFMGDGCEYGYSGFEKDGNPQEPVKQIYEHVHTPCGGSEIIYHGFVWFWVAGEYATKNEPIEGVSKGYQCGTKPLVTTLEDFLLVAEFYPDVGGPAE